MSFSENRRNSADLAITGISARLASARRMLALKTGFAQGLEETLDPDEQEAAIDSQIEALKQSVVTVCISERYTDGGFFNEDGTRAKNFINKSVGTGTFIDSTHILTNRHVVDSITKAEDKSKYLLSVVPAGEEDSIRVKSYFELPLLDIVILELEKPRDKAALPLGDSSTVKVGDVLTSIGSPHSLERAGTVGRARVKKLPNGKLPVKYQHGDFDNGKKKEPSEYIETEMGLIRPGNSGGAIFDKDGKIIGVAVGGVERLSDDGDPTILGRVIPINFIKTFVENHSVYAEVKQLVERLDVELFAENIPNFRKQFKLAFKQVKALLKIKGLSENVQREIMSDRWMHWIFNPYIERAQKVKEVSKHRRHTRIVEDLYAEYQKVFGVSLKRYDHDVKSLNLVGTEKA